MSSELPTPPSAPPARKPRRPGVSQEKIMVLFTLFFIAGILLYAVVPEGPGRGIGITAISLGVVWALYKGS